MTIGFAMANRSAAIRIPAFGAVFLRGEGTFPRPRKKQEAKELEKT